MVMAEKCSDHYNTVVQKHVNLYCKQQTETKSYYIRIITT